MVLIKGLQKTSLVDYPEKVSCVIFTAGCNFRCPFCQNPDLIEKERYDKLDTIQEEDFLDFLDKRKKWLDAVVITGGEPTLHKDLPELIAKIKEKEFLVKLDTNGSNPAMLRDIIKGGLVDFIAMDVKMPIEDYGRATGISPDKDIIKKSIDLIREAGNQGIDYEFRTTIVPGMVGKDELQRIGEMLKGSRKLALQQFDNRNTYDPAFRNAKPCTKEHIESLKKNMETYFGKVEVRIE